jgi:hypothetical protein
MTLLARFGALAAERIAAGKLADAPHLVNGDAPFWRAVVQNIRAAQASR